MGEPSHRRPRLMGVGRSVAGATADEETVRALYATHATALTYFVTGLVGGDRARAEDIVQETMLRAWRSPQVLADDRGSTRSWLFTVARNLVIDLHRARSVRPQEVGDGVLTYMPAENDLEASVELSVLRWEIADAVAQLGKTHREVLVETYLRQRTVAEAAERLGIPPGTVKSRTYYAMRQLRLLMEERGIDVGGLSTEPGR
jgi:RNA polymerase sigma-70 factor, ECF subfamily